MKRLLLLEVTEKPSPPIPENDRSVKELELLRSNFYSLNLSVSLSLSPPFSVSVSLCMCAYMCLCVETKI
jgi:hypothetical protein